VRIEKRGVAETAYLTPAAEFALSAIDLKSGDCFQSGPERNVEILLCIDGKAAAKELAPGARNLTIDRGGAVLVPAAVPAYQLTGPATLYRATVP
jgi:mannose-6-phosphate isomerase class I